VILNRATRLKRIAMMALMIGSMLLHTRVAQHTLIIGATIVVFVILAIYTIFVARLLKREGAGRSAISRAIVAGILPIGSRLFFSRSGQ
jgi:hypothetical protein